MPVTPVTNPDTIPLVMPVTHPDTIPLGVPAAGNDALRNKDMLVVGMSQGASDNDLYMAFKHGEHRDS